MKVLVVGGVAGGASAAARVRRINEGAEIIVFERGPHVSFSNCALPYRLSGTIKSTDTLLLMTPEAFKNEYNIEVRTDNEVTDIDRKKKTVTVRTSAGKTYQETYDKLILSPGADAVRPPIPGIHSDHVFTLKNVVDVAAIVARLDKGVKNVAVIGGGFIGLEAAENLRQAGYNVNLIEALPQVMNHLDPEMAAMLHKELIMHRVNLHLNAMAAEIKSDSIVLKNGTVIPAEAVILGTGVRPVTDLAKKAGLKIGSRGGIAVNANLQTCDPDIYAVGDAIEVIHRITGDSTLLPLAGVAQRQARAAADHIFGHFQRSTGVIGSNVVKVFNLHVASTGLSEKEARQQGYNCDYTYLIPMDAVKIMPVAHPLHLKVVYEKPTGKILGAQAAGEGGSDKRVDVIATAMMFNATLEDLRDLELCYAPTFGTAKDAVNYAGMVGLNLLHDTYAQVPHTQLRSLVEKGEFIVDVRTKEEFAAGHVKGAVNIPLSEFRKRLAEFPKDRPIYLYCRSAQRSYQVTVALQYYGYEAYNITGSYLAFSIYESVEDHFHPERESILTAYNFK